MAQRAGPAAARCLSARVAGGRPAPAVARRRRPRRTRRARHRNERRRRGTSDRSVVLLDRADGVRIWRRHVPGTVAAGPLIAGNAVYVATQAVPDGRVLALRLRTGAPLWGAHTGGVSAGLVLTDSVIVAATDRGTVVALDPRARRR